MSAVIIPFGSVQPRQRSQGWRPDEIAEVYRVVELLGRAGVAVSVDSGRTDEGDPWLAVFRDDTEDVIVHVARIDDRVIVASTASERVFSGSSLSDTLRRVVGTEVLVLPRGGGSLYLHPAALLAAFIATALTHATAGDATGSDVGAPGRSHSSDADATPVSPVGLVQQHGDNLRSLASGDASPPPVRHEAPAYPPSLVATAVATVVLSVTLVGEDQFAQVEREFLEALRVASPAALHQADERPARAHNTDGSDAVSLDSELGAVGVGNQELQLQPTSAEGLVDPTEAGVALPRWLDLGTTTLADPQLALTLDAPSGVGRPWLSAPPAAVDALAGQEAPEVTTLVGETAAGMAAVLSEHSATVGALPAPSRVVATSGADAETSHASGHASPLVELSQLFFFRSSIEMLGVFRFDDLKTSDVPDAYANRAHPSVQGATASTASPASSPTDPESLRAEVTFVPYEATAGEKALALSDFAFGGAHEIHAPPEVLASVRGRIASNSFLLEGVDRVIVFDAPSANADAFMLMPGVAMLRSSLTQDVVQPAAVPAVEFALSDGSTLRLLGMIDI